MKVATVVGARPQFIKAAPVSRALAAAGVAEVLIHTGQHYDSMMSAVFFEELGLSRPDHHLGVGSGPHGQQTGRMLELLEAVLKDERPDRVLVYGDTNSTLAGSLASAKLHIPVAHVEAGLRSFNRRQPEEINRLVADQLADLLFAPTDAAVGHLLREGASEASVHLVGDVMYDATLMFRERILDAPAWRARLGLADRPFALVTIHRPENTDVPRRLSAIIEGLRRVARELPIVWPVHPRTTAALAEHRLAHDLPDALRLIPPVGYLDMQRLEAAAEVVVTDSGGVQKEAYFAGAPCVTLRDETEWVELIETGWNRLCPPEDSAAIARAILAAVGVRGRPVELYGGGRAAERIARVIASQAERAL